MIKKEFSPNTRQFLIVAADTVCLPFALWLSISLRWGDIPYTTDWRDILVYLLTTLFSVLVFGRLGLYRAMIRFMGTKAIIAVLKGISISALIVGCLVFLTRAEGVPRSIPFIYWGIALFFVGGSRFAVWLHYQSILKKECEKVAIYGAGDAGRQLLTALRHSGQYETAVFIDDNRKIKGRVINGVQVYRPHHLPDLIKKESITQILLAIPSVAAHRKKEIISNLEALPVHVKTIPGLADIVSGKAKIEELREVDIEDLLGRDSIAPDNELFEHCIKNKVVMVTGAGGSIGSELCRQIIKHQPRQIILLELSEFALYSIEQELKKTLTSEKISIIALLGSVQNKKHLLNIFTVYGVQTLYHAAAYKHVPIVEENMIEGIRNNIFGTLRLAEAALAANVEAFVLISTDKAVRPTNVMGASKRFAEMVLQALSNNISEQKMHNKTYFCMVRFGNVLGSSGSVVPLFSRQIQQGGPVTVTDADIIRYFMTIPEAAQLVIQAASLGIKEGQGGDMFVLDMGEPVKIAELAKKMIHLSGFEVKDEDNPHGDIEIHYTGLRAGEKLYEELLIGDNVSNTQHPRIMRAEENYLALPVIEEKLKFLDKACDELDINRLRTILIDSETGYVPDKNQPVDLLWSESEKKKS